MKEHNIYIAILITMIVVLMGGLSYHIANPTVIKIRVPLPPLPPVMVEVIKEVYIDREVLPTIKLVEFRVEIDHIHNESGLHEFNTVKDLMEWLATDNISDRPYVDSSYVCSDFAIALVKSAYNDGKFMGISRISDRRHQVNFTMIDRIIWEIDPITDHVKRVGYVYRSWR